MSVVFPLPLPELGLFCGGIPKLSSKKWRSLIRKRLLHIVVVALNFLEGSLNMKNIHLLGRQPNSVQRKIHARLRLQLTTCDLSSREPLPLIPGRSGSEFISSLFHLEGFAKKHDCFDSKHYTSGPVDFEKSAVGSISKDDAEDAARAMYTSLNAGRLTLVGTGSWRAQDHLDDELWLPYVEPKVLRHDAPIDYSVGPDLRREDPQEYLLLAKKWSQLGLLSLTDEPPHRDTFTRIFNCFKTSEFDRQIGDRRLGNAAEYSISGPSRYLPAGYHLVNITVPKGHCVFGSITDRKDFYHQCSATDARAFSNVTPFSFKQSEFADDPALKHLWALKTAKRKGRAQVGDFLGGRVSSTFDENSPVFPCFRSLLQGDHLGVEFALSAHAHLLETSGVLCESKRAQGYTPFPKGPDYQVLVIDDFVSISVCAEGTQPCDSGSCKDLEKAAKAYAQEKVLGSTEKDILGSRHFKAIGAEVNASRKLQSAGLTTVAAPMQKRIALVVLALRTAQLNVITPTLASRIAGNFTSIFMFRRCLTCVLNEIYQYGSGETESGNVVYEMPRSTAQELVLAAILSFVSVSDVSAKFTEKIFASDASLAKGAFCSREVSSETAQVMWLGGDKKGTYTRLDPPFRELGKAAGLDFDDAELAEVVNDSLESVPHHLDFVFDFLEVCAGVGSVSKAVADLGLRVCTPIELSDSPAFDVTCLDLVIWICNMLRSGRLKSIMVEPVCTTFSAAAHPCVRSYKVPRGFDPSSPKTYLGNRIAFHCLFLCWYAALCECPSLCEQPRLSKMCWLSIWVFLRESLGFSESVVASCQFGSCHRKEFRLLSKYLDASALETRCPGGHSHVRIQGKFTKDSAVYTPALAKHIARAFAVALRQKASREADCCQVKGLESVIANDLLMTGEWKVEKVWDWDRSSHINLLESHAYLAILRDRLLAGGDCRFTSLLDSRVAKGSHAKGRSSAKALGPSLRRGAAYQIAGGLYPALGFAPTRLNTADAPTRSREIQKLARFSIADKVDFRKAQLLHALPLSRIAAAWVRFVVLAGSVVSADGFDNGVDHLSHSEWTCKIYLRTFLNLWTLPCIRALDLCPPLGLLLCPVGLFALLTVCVLFCVAGSWAHLGYHGGHVRCKRREACRAWPKHFMWRIGLAGLLTYLRICGCGLCCGLAVLGVCISSRATFHRPKPLPLAVLVSFSHGMPLEPRNAEEVRRADRRSNVQLIADRVVRPQTRSRRDQLLDHFNSWLLQKAEISVAELVDSKDADPETVAEYLVMYGRELFYAGRAYGRYSETINAVASRRPAFRRQLVAAWDLAFSWVSDEPSSHHPALPLTLLLAISTLSLLWGWAREASIFLITWCGVLRIGEVTAAKRGDLVLPSDGVPGRAFALLQIQQPKTRGVAAKHQAARIDPEDVVRLITAVFGNLAQDQRLWDLSTATLRKRFASLQASLGLPVRRTATEVPYDLSSLRPGGATHLLHRFEDAEFVRRRGRWLSSRVCEVYLQEIAVSTYTNRLSPKVQQNIQKLADAFPEVLDKALYFIRSFIPFSAWPKLW